MAYFAALASLVELIEDIIVKDRYPNFVLGKKPVMKSLHEKFKFLEELLQDHSINDSVEGRIRDVAYRAQDIIESEILNQIQETQGRDGDKYVEDIQMVQQEIDLVVQEMMVAIKDGQRRLEGSKLNCDSLDHIGASEEILAGGNTMVGLDECLDTIKEQLCGQSSQLQIIAITGMGGIGKTTLARNSFDDALIVYHFYCRAWITVSQDYSLTRILQSILKSMGLMGIDSLGGEGEEAALKERVHKSLKGSRYLIVMDDVWSTQVWDDVKWIFPDDCNGSRVILTTRLLDIAQYVAGAFGFLHEMQFLNNDQSWNLLQERVFAHDHCSPELMPVGKFIASKCGGLPLAIVVIAGILSKVRSLHDWMEIATDVTAILSRTDEHLPNILSLSYNHLPHQLKSCFLYMGSFPEDHEINVSKLLKLWVAEGFLKLADESKSIERVAEECLEDLVQTNLVLVTKKRSNGQFKFCVLHDILRDFCRQRAFEECFFHVMQKEGYLHPRGAENQRRIILDCSHLCQRGTYETTCKLVRSILCFGKQDHLKINGVDWDCCKLVRVLDLPRMKASTTPIAIFQMLHLKYLGLHLDCHDLKIYLPPSLSVFQNLQTLVICSSNKLCPAELPPQIWTMSQLRHVIIDTMILPPVPMAGDMPIQKLVCLQTLMQTFNFIFTIEALEMIPNLRKLKVECSGIRPLIIWEFYCIDNLVSLLQLEELKISFLVFNHVPFVKSPCSLAFPPSLKKLSLQGCRVPWKYMTVVRSLPNLQVLRLRHDSFVGEEWEAMEGEFKCLKFILLEWLYLENWRAESIHFPVLEHLMIKNCRRLRRIPLEIGDIPTLKFIDVISSKDARDSAVLIRQEQQAKGNDVLQVRVHGW